MRLLMPVKRPDDANKARYQTHAQRAHRDRCHRQDGTRRAHMDRNTHASKDQHRNGARGAHKARYTNAAPCSPWCPIRQSMPLRRNPSFAPCAPPLSRCFPSFERMLTQPLRRGATRAVASRNRSPLIVDTSELRSPNNSCIDELCNSGKVV
jgi:hypothetical protein